MPRTKTTSWDPSEHFKTREQNEFIFKELETHEGVLTGQGRPDLHEKQSIRDELNSIFRQTLKEAFDGGA